MEYPIYRDVDHWAIINEAIVSAFNDEETKIPVVEVLIGTLHYDDIDFYGNKVSERRPITRWISRRQYDYFVRTNDSVEVL